MARPGTPDPTPATADGNDELVRAETIGDPPGFIAEATPGVEATADAWRAHLAWLRSLPADAELRGQRIRDAEGKLRELERPPAPAAKPQR